MDELKDFFFNKQLLLDSFKDTFSALAPKIQLQNPIIFGVYVSALIMTGIIFSELSLQSFSLFHFLIFIWLWLTVLFANFSHALAENINKAQTNAFIFKNVGVYAKQDRDTLNLKELAQSQPRAETVVCQAGDVIPANGEIIEGLATLDESAITGESAPVLRENGPERGVVTAGTKVLSGKIKIRIASEQGNNFFNRMMQIVESHKNYRSSNEITLIVVLSYLIIICLLVCVTTKIFGEFSLKLAPDSHLPYLTIPSLLALFVCLLPSTIAALLSPIRTSSLDRLTRKNVIAFNGGSLEASSDLDVLLIDKTGTLTKGDRTAIGFMPVTGVSENELACAAWLASFSDPTPEGKSITALASKYELNKPKDFNEKAAIFHPFSSRTRISGIDLIDPSSKAIRSIRKGAMDSVRKHIESLSGTYPHRIDLIIQSIAHTGGTPLLVSDNNRIIGIIYLKDTLKSALKERFAELRKIGIKTVMVTGDNPITSAAVAAMIGVDEYIAEATPEIKLERIREEQAAGRIVAMLGDGTNDAPALAQADIGVTMNTGSQAAQEAGNMIDLDNNPAKFIDVIIIGKQMLMTRGAFILFTFTSKIVFYFAFIPALFYGLYATEWTTGPFSMLNLMRLHSPESAILSALILNALFIPMLLPIALNGLSFSLQPSQATLKRNILVFGLGGFIAPFIVLKGIDLLVSLLF